ncbi:uncharacterized protein PFLUO_LOCUS3138 [Penicillium psychrofluorescens]|uniref:uncharacterized protein n=1 Tax=Penicillium psychrofluorescens TaxID=3158075 RepID=UPI003CCD1A6C
MQKNEAIADVHVGEEALAVKGTHGSDESSVLVDQTAERKLLWKIDLLILPILFLFYMLSYLDRINIGNARISGMNEELHLDVGNRFNVAIFLFYVLYIPLEIPSNIWLKHARPSLYLPALMFCWGIITMCTGFVHSYQALYALRVLLGLFEAGLVPGVVYVTSMYYRRYEYQKRLSLMFVATSVGGAFGGLLAYAIANLSGQRGFLGWRWIFIIEGAVTAFIALLAPFIMVDWPNQCRFFTPAEKDLIRLRFVDDGGEFRMDTLNRDSLLRILLDWKIYLGSLTYMGLTTSGLAMSFFLPTILKEYGWESTEAQVHTIPVYAFTLGLTLVMSWASDRLQHRYGFLIFCCLMATIGYGMLLNMENLSRNARYAACFLVAGGGICSGPIAIGFLSNNLAGHWKRAVGSAMQVSFAGFAGIIGSVMFLQREAPFYRTGLRTGLGMAWVSGVAATITAVCVWRENRKRDRGERDERLGWPAEVVNNLGDDHPHFRFTL